MVSLQVAAELYEARRFDLRPEVGDRIVVESERVSQSPRAGVIEEVVREDPPRVRVRWDDDSSDPQQACKPRFALHHKSVVANAYIII